MDRYADHYLVAERKLAALAVDKTLDERSLRKEIMKLKTSLMATGPSGLQQRIIEWVIIYVEMYVRERLFYEEIWDRCVAHNEYAEQNNLDIPYDDFPYEMFADGPHVYEIYHGGPALSALEYMLHSLKRLRRADKLERRKFGVQQLQLLWAQVDYERAVPRP